MSLEPIQWLLERMAEQAFASFRSWESFAAALRTVPGLFVDFTHGFAWPYLLSSLLLAWCIFVTARLKGDPAVSFREFAFPGRLYRHPSATLDFRFVAVDILLYALLYVPILTGINLLAIKAIGAALSGVAAWEPPRTWTPVGAVGAAFLFLLLHDFISYCAHALYHHVPALWAFHEVHHSAEVLTPATAYRVHPVELIGVAILNAPVIGLAAWLYQNLAGPPVQLATVFGLSIIGLLGGHLRHSHILFSFGPTVSRIVLSPAQHVIHHSTDPAHWNKNLGIKFAIWDYLFGTLYVPKPGETVRVGLPDMGRQKFSSVPGLYLLPFARAMAGIPGGRRRGA